MKKKRVRVRDVKNKKKHPAGPGRPKGSTLDKTWRLTPNQMKVAEVIIDAGMNEGLFPSSVVDVVKLTGRTSRYVRDLLKREDFQAYFNWLLSTEGVILEGAFWRGMALGLSVGDVKVLELYARMTGKIAAAKKDTKIEITVKSPDGAPALPAYTKDIIEAEIISDEEE